MRHDYLPKLAAIVRIAAEGFHQHGDTGLVFDEQLQHHLIEVRPMITAIAWGDRNDRCLWLRRTVIAPIDMEARGVEMGKPGRHAQTVRGFSRDTTIKWGDARRVKGIETTAQHIIIQGSRLKPWPHQLCCRLVLEKARDHVEWLIHEPEAVEDQRFDGVAK